MNLDLPLIVRSHCLSIGEAYCAVDSIRLVRSIGVLRVVEEPVEFVLLSILVFFANHMCNVVDDFEYFMVVIYGH